jgi:proteasome lid subunit RPN8/RPN11
MGKVEVGRVICRVGGELVPGPIVRGSHRAVTIPLRCPPGGQAVGLVHTHPGERVPKLSKQDISEGRRLALDFVCAVSPETKKTRCAVLGRLDSNR